VIHRISYTYQRTKPVPLELQAQGAVPIPARTADLRPASRAR
jgi:hypothetical protein